MFLIGVELEPSVCVYSREYFKTHMEWAGPLEFSASTRRNHAVTVLDVVAMVQEAAADSLSEALSKDGFMAPYS